MYEHNQQVEVDCICSVSVSSWFSESLSSVFNLGLSFRTLHWYSHNLCMLAWLLSAMAWMGSVGDLSAQTPLLPFC